MFTKTLDILYHIIDPLQFMLLTTTFIPGTILNLITNLQFSTLLSPSSFKDAWFARFWSYYGPLIRIGSSPTVSPLLANCHGIVLDIGPGSGEWLSLFPKSNITKIYGVEPNRDHHPALRKKITECGLEGIYEIVPVGIEDLESGEWVVEGKVDAVVTLLCLCSIPRPREMISRLYGMLGEGGVWVLYEHVKVKRSWWAGWYQWAVDFIWPHFLGGCEITRDTERWLKEIGPWNKVDLVQPDTEPDYQILPHIKGILVK